MKSIRIITSLIAILLLNAFASAQEVSSLKDTLKIDGNINARSVLYTIDGIDGRRTPISFVLGANITISKGEFSLPFGFTYSEQERGFSQPFNQFGIAPSYKWVKTYMGYNSLDWNKYTLGGAQFLGAGVELNPKKFRFGLMYGRFKRATPVDSIGFINNNKGLPSYDRRGWAGRIGIGSESKFVDLIFFKGQDKIHGNSPLQKDSLTQIFPAENTSIGIKSQIAIGKAVSLFFDGGVSLFNRDLTAEKIEPEEVGMSSLTKSIHTLRLSTTAYYGGEAGLNFSIKTHSFRLSTQFVLPDYQAMGIYYMDNDVFTYGFNHSFTAWKSKISINYGINRLNDNLLNKKEYTTIRLQPIVSLSFNPSSKWGVETNWNNFYTTQEDGTVQLSDSFRTNQQNPGLTITPHVQWGDTQTYHTIFGMYTKMQLIDNNPHTAIQSQYQATVYGLNYGLNLLNKNLAINSGANYTINDNNYINEKALGLSLGISKSSKKSKWSVGSNLGAQFSNFSNAISLGLNGNYQLKHKQALNFGLTLINNQAKTANTNNFNELTFTLTYNKNFNYVHKK